MRLFSDNNLYDSSCIRFIYVYRCYTYIKLYIYTHICTCILLIMCHALFRTKWNFVNGPIIEFFRLGKICIVIHIYIYILLELIISFIICVSVIYAFYYKMTIINSISSVLAPSIIWMLNYLYTRLRIRVCRVSHQQMINNVFNKIHNYRLCFRYFFFSELPRLSISS